MMSDPILIGSSEDPFRFGMPVHIVPAARRRHLALFGASGAGKSSLLRNMIAEDILAGHGLTVVDPHGQLVEDIIENHIPRRRTNDVIYFNPKDRERAFVLGPARNGAKDSAASSFRTSSVFSKNSGRTPSDRAWKTSSATASMRLSNSDARFPSWRYPSS